MLPALLALNIFVWAVVLLYSLRVIPALARRWHPVPVLLALAVASGLSFFSYQQAQKLQVKARFEKYYHAAIDERQRGNLAEAERHLEQARAIAPGNPDVEKQLQEIKQEKPAEKRVQTKAARVEKSAQVPPPTSPPTKTEPAKESRAGEKPKPAAHKPSPFEITHYGLDVALDPTAHTLKALATIRVCSRGEAVPVLDFSLNPEFKPTTILVDGQPARFTHTNDLLAVTPSRQLGRKGSATVQVTYARSGEAVISGGQGLIAPHGIYFISEARWYPATGELDFRSPVRVKATVPKGYTVVSVGALKGVQKDEKTSTFHWETDRLASMVSLSAAKYERASVRVPAPVGAAGAQELEVSCYTFPQHRDRAQAFLKEAAAIVRYYQRSFGPYPYEKLAIAEIPLFPGGYGTTSFVMILDKAFEARKVDREFLAHEIAHQWWGNSVFPQGLGAAWLTEAFANYSAWMYETSVLGNPRVLQKRVAKGTAEYFDAAAREGDQALIETDPYAPVGARQEIIYEKGAVVLHMLRRQIGDRTFMRVLRRFADDYRFGKAKIEDFRRIAEQESATSLGWFFDQWLGRKGGMELAYSFDTEPLSPTQNNAVLMITQSNPPYRARVKVTLQVENKVETHEVELTGEHHTFKFPVKGRVMSVLLDPEGAYLMKPPKWVVADEKSRADGG